MGKIMVWTRQHKSVAKILEKEDRYTAKKEIVINNEEVKLQIHAYNWLMRAHPDLKNKPEDADFPVWVSFQREGTMLLAPDTVILELEVDEKLLTQLDVIKWTKVNNLSYIPADINDMKRHKELLAAYGVSDAKACMSRFYPEIKREIEESWDRVFDDNVKSESGHCYGLLWEIKKEWIKSIKE